MSSRKNSLFSPWCQTILSCLLGLMQVACSSLDDSAKAEGWMELSFLVDGIHEIQLSIPKPPFGNELPKMQFIVTQDNSPTRLFMAGYDPGRGMNRDLLMTHISGVVVRVDRENGEGVALSLEDIKNEIYLSRLNAAEDFEIIGEQVLGGQSWLRVDLTGGTQRRGVSYALPIHENYTLNLGMHMYGEDSNKTRLFKKRQETLEQILTTVQVSTVDF